MKSWLNERKDIEIVQVKSNIFCQGASGLFLLKHNWIINQMEITYYRDNPKNVHYDLVWGYGYDALFNIHNGMHKAEDDAHQQVSNNNGYKDNCCLLIIER